MGWLELVKVKMVQQGWTVQVQLERASLVEGWDPEA